MVTFNPDVNAIALEVAKTFGGACVPVNQDGEFPEYVAYVDITNPGEHTPPYRITLGTTYKGRKTARISVRIGLIERAPQSLRTYNLPEMPRATLSLDRPMQSLMADISRRVVNHRETLPILQAWAERIAEHNKSSIDNRLATDEYVERFGYSLPRQQGWNVSQDDAYSVNLTRPLCVGRLPDLEVRAESVTFRGPSYSMSHSKALRILAILAEPDATTTA